MTPTSRMAALVVALILGIAFVVIVLMTTPWQPLASVGGRVEPDPTRDFTAAEIARASAYVRSVNVPSLVGMALALVVSIVLGFTSLGARIVSAATSFLPSWWAARVVVAAIVLLGMVWLVGLPLRAWRESIVREYGLSVQTWSSWFIDQARSFGIGAGTSIVLVLLLVGLARWLPRTWWIAAAAGAAGFVVALSFLYPLVVEPVFNKFSTLQDGPLRDDLLAMAERDGVPVRDVLVADASRRTTALNAYVSGFGSTRRIVVYDTLLARPADEVKLVVAHELGHAKKSDVLNGTLLGALGAALAVCLLAWCLSSAGLLRRAGVGGVTDPRAVALVLALLAIAAAISGPVQSLVSRRIEARADVHSLDLTQDPATFVRAMRTLGVTNLSNPYPNPILYGLYATHPSVPERLALARTWARVHGLPEPGPAKP